VLHARWLGRVRYRDAHALQHALFEHADDYLLLLEHPHVYTLGVRASLDHVLVPAPASWSATRSSVCPWAPTPRRATCMAWSSS